MASLLTPILRAIWRVALIVLIWQASFPIFIHDLDLDLGMWKRLLWIGTVATLAICYEASCEIFSILKKKGSEK